MLARTHATTISVLQPIAGLENPGHEPETNREKAERHRQADADADVGSLVKAPAKTADQINDRVVQRERAKRRRQHVDRVEGAAEERERRDHQHRDELELLEALGPDPDDETEQAEGG